MRFFKKDDTIKLKMPYRGFLSEGGKVLDVMHDYIVFMLKFKGGKQIIAKATLRNMDAYFFNTNAGLTSIKNYLGKLPDQQTLYGMPLQQGSSIFYNSLKEFPQDFYLEQDISDNFRVLFNT